MGRKRKGYSAQFHPVDNSILADWDGDEKLFSDFFFPVQMTKESTIPNHGKTPELNFIAEEICQAVKDGDSARIRELADVVDMVAAGKNPDLLRQAVIHVFEDLEPDLPTRDELLARVSRMLNGHNHPAADERRIRAIVKDLGFKFENTPKQGG